MCFVDFSSYFGNTFFCKLNVSPCFSNILVGASLFIGGIITTVLMDKVIIMHIFNHSICLLCYAWILVLVKQRPSVVPVSFSCVVNAESVI